MAIRIREINGHTVALCAAMTNHKNGDLYLDDNILKPAKVIVSKKKEMPKPEKVIEQVKDGTNIEESEQINEIYEKENLQTSDNNKKTP